MASLSAIFNGRFHHFCAPLAAFTYLLSFYYEKRLGKRSGENTWYYFWAATQLVKFGKKINGKKSEMAHSNFRNIWLKSMWKSKFHVILYIATIEFMLRIFRNFSTNCSPPDIKKPPPFLRPLARQHVKSKAASPWHNGLLCQKEAF